MSEANSIIEQRPVSKESILQSMENSVGEPPSDKERRLRDLAADLWLHIDRHSEGVPLKDTISSIKRLPGRMLRPFRRP